GQARKRHEARPADQEQEGGDQDMRPPKERTAVPESIGQDRCEENGGDAHRDQEGELTQGRIEAEAARGQVWRIVPDEKEVARVARRKEGREGPKFPSADEGAESGLG